MRKLFVYVMFLVLGLLSINFVFATSKANKVLKIENNNVVVYQGGKKIDTLTTKGNMKYSDIFTAKCTIDKYIAYSITQKGSIAIVSKFDGICDSENIETQFVFDLVNGKELVNLDDYVELLVGKPLLYKSSIINDKIRITFNTAFSKDEEEARGKYSTIFLTSEKIKSINGKIITKAKKGYNPGKITIDISLADISKTKLNYTTKNLGNGFILNQTGNKTFLTYNGEEVYDWIHFPETNIPFIWDEGCKKLTEKFNKIKKVTQESKQKAWDELGEVGKKECIKENLFNTITIEKTINSGFYTINIQKYESVSKILFDISTLYIYDNFFLKEIKGNSEYITGINLDKISKIEIGKTGIYILFNSNRDNLGGLVFIKHNTKEGNVIFTNNTNVGKKDKNYIEITDFELLPNKQIKIKYKGQNLKDKEKIINL